MKARPGAVIGLIMALAGFGAAQEIHLKTRNIRAGDTQAIVTPADIHQLVLFDHTPGIEDLDALLAAGAQVVSVVPDNAVVVRLSGSAIPFTAGIQTVRRIESSDKIS